MSRLLIAIGAVALLAGGAPAADAKKITVTWHGQSFFEITTGKGTRIVIDPHLIDAYGRPDVDADLVLLSHNHTDHTQTSAVRNIDKAKVIRGWKDERGDGKKVDWNIVDETFKDVKIRTVGTFHDNMNGMKRGLNTILILEIDGLKFAHLGDLGHTLSKAQLEKLGDVDVLFVPVGGVYTLNGEDAAVVVKSIKPRRFVIPMHYGTKVYDDVLPVDEFLDNSKKETIKVLKTNVLAIDPSEKPPAEPEIVVMQWEPMKEKEKEKEKEK
jgi:L-ascorbate metabolism protein UlaG (beta-lactamase superfamily)